MALRRADVRRLRGVLVLLPSLEQPQGSTSRRWALAGLYAGARIEHGRRRSVAATVTMHVESHETDLKPAGAPGCATARDCQNRNPSAGLGSRGRSCRAAYTE